MGPQQFRDRIEAYSEREEEKQKRADYRAGVIAAAIFNMAPFREPGPEARPHHFFSSLPQPAPVVKSPEEIRTLFHLHFGGSIRKKAEA